MTKGRSDEEPNPALVGAPEDQLHRALAEEPEDEPDPALVEAALVKGDLEAFLRLAGDEWKRSYRIACGVTERGPDAENLAKRALANVWRSRKTFKPGSRFWPWAAKIIVNLRKDDLRAQGKDANRLVPLRFELPDTSTLSPEQAVAFQEAWSLAGKILTVDEWIILIRLMKGDSKVAIGKQFSVTGPAIGARVLKIRRKIRWLFLPAY